MKKQALLLLILCVQILAYGGDLESSLTGRDLHFIENKGQIRDHNGNPRTDIDFILQDGAVTVYIGDGALHYQFAKRVPMQSGSYTRENPPKTYQAVGQVAIARLDVTLEGSDKEAVFSTSSPGQTKMHYYNTEDPDGVTGVKTYGKVTYKNIYPSIDWVLYTQGKTFKYDFIIRPGGKVEDIRLQYEGAESMHLEKDGSLRVSGSMGSISESAPFLYELESRKAVKGAYVLHGNEVSYQTDPHSGTLVIDPGVEWATYFGGESGDDAAGNNIAYDSEGNIYISGITISPSNIATTGAHQTVIGSGGQDPFLQDAFLAKFDTAGILQWATYYGGHGAIDSSTYLFLINQYGKERAAVVTVDAFDNVYLAGSTYSVTGIATPGSFQATGSSVNSQRDFDGGYNGFLVKFNNAGIRQWGTYYGASTAATAFTSVACDQAGNIYAAGYADSSLSTTGALVTSGAHQTMFNASPVQPSWFPGFIPAGPINFNGLLVKFDSSGGRQWATYYGGVDPNADPMFNPSSSKIFDVVCDEAGHVYIGGCGIAGSVTAGTHQAMLTDGVKAFVSKFDADGTQIWGTYLNAGSGEDRGFSLDVDGSHLYVAGTLYHGPPSDTLIVTPGCHQPTLINGTSGTVFNGFLLQMDPMNGTRNWGTYYGAEGATYVFDVKSDRKGNVFITGQTNCSGDLYTISTLGSHKDTFTAGTDAFQHDAFVAQFDSSGVRKWATYYGDTKDDRGNSLVCSPTGTLYLVGNTFSANSIATPGAHQDALGGSVDVFLVRFLPVDIALNAVVDPERDTVCMGEVPFTVAVKNQGRMDKDDTLKISYTFNGPSTGSLDTFFTGGLDAGVEENFELGALDLAFPGVYDITIYLHYTRDDDERLNDTIHLSVTTTNAEPVAEISVSQVGTTYHFSNPSGQPSDTYHWDFGDGNTSDEATPSHSYSETDSYLVTLVITGFCGSDTATMLMEGIGDGSGISDPALAAKLSVYPNPAQDVLFVKAESGLRAEAYRIVNVLGQELMQGTLEQSAQLDIRSLSPGSYFLHIRTDKGRVSKPFQVLKK